MKFFFLALAITFSLCSAAQITITTDSVIQTGTCAGSTIVIRYKTTGGNFGSGNRFTAQLSNAFGQFTNPVTIGTSNLNLGIILATLPKNAQFGFLYRVRVVSSNPAITGSPSPNTIIITSTSLTATINTPEGTSLCPGDSLRLQAFLPNATYQWSTGATSQSIKIAEPGSYWVKVTDPLGCDARDTVEIIERPGCVLGDKEVRIYPNPAANHSTIYLTGVPTGYSVQFIDVAGRLSTMLPVNNQRVDLAGTYLAPGMYILRLVKNDQTKVLGRLVIQ